VGRYSSSSTLAGSSQGTQISAIAVLGTILPTQLHWQLLLVGLLGGYRHDPCLCSCLYCQACMRKVCQRAMLVTAQHLHTVLCCAGYELRCWQHATAVGRRRYMPTAPAQ
jgi:hypothetical protein